MGLPFLSAADSSVRNSLRSKPSAWFLQPSGRARARPPAVFLSWRAESIQLHAWSEPGKGVTTCPHSYSGPQWGAYHPPGPTELHADTTMPRRAGMDDIVPGCSSAGWAPRGPNPPRLARLAAPAQEKLRLGGAQGGGRSRPAVVWDQGCRAGGRCRGTVVQIPKTELPERGNCLSSTFCRLLALPRAVSSSAGEHCPWLDSSARPGLRAFPSSDPQPRGFPAQSSHPQPMGTRLPARRWSGLARTWQPDRPCSDLQRAEELLLSSRVPSTPLGFSPQTEVAEFAISFPRMLGPEPRIWRKRSCALQTE